MLWQELQYVFYERTMFYFNIEPDVNFHSVRLPHAENPRGLTRYPCRVNGIPNRFDFYRRQNWFSRIMRANITVALPSTCTSAPSVVGGETLQTIPGRDLACKSGPHYVAVAKVAWLLQHATSLQELMVRVTVRDSSDSRRRTQPINPQPEGWWGVLEPFHRFKNIIKEIELIHITDTSTIRLRFQNQEWCLDFHVGDNKSTSIIRRCPDPNFEPLPGNHWGSYNCVAGACPCGCSFEDSSSEDGEAEEESENISLQRLDAVQIESLLLRIVGNSMVGAEDS